MTAQMKTSLLSLIPASVAITALLMLPVHAGYAGSVLFFTGLCLIVVRDYGRSLASLQVETPDCKAGEAVAENLRLAA